MLSRTENFIQNILAGKLDSSNSQNSYGLQHSQLRE